jgi:hypothetical protein
MDALDGETKFFPGGEAETLWQIRTQLQTISCPGF